MTYQINEELAREAKRVNSFGDYIDGSATSGYNNYLKEFNEAVEELKEKNKTFAYPATAEELELVDYYADKYAKKLAWAINKENAIDGMCPSVMICGAGNFPVRKKQKQNQARETHWNATKDLYNVTDNCYFKKIKNILLNTNIKSNDALALEKLKNKLQDLQETHEEMKARNAYYRKNGTLKGCEGITDEEAARYDEKIKSCYTWEQQPYPSYALTSSNAKIKATKDRIAELEKAKAEAGNESEKYKTVEGVQVIENAEAMRIQLIFDDIPSAETRELLKHNGFRWSPKFGAWQRQLNANGKYAVNQILKQL